jgi:5'-deoxynucleotidase YfbR-like HD superfamily hydrolase
MTDLTESIIELGALALRFGRIDRTACYHADRVTPESDADHTIMLGWLACPLAALWYPDLNPGLVAQFALIHDAPEVYAGDTPTLRLTAEVAATKAEAEQEAIRRLDTQFLPTLPYFTHMIGAYESQVLPEARFVRALDKILPKIVHLLDGATGLIEQGMDAAELTERMGRQRVDMAGYAGEFRELLDLHAELTRRVAELLSTKTASTCPCRAWAGDIRVPRPNGHHPLCDTTGRRREVVTASSWTES